ncbi:phytanoyl-CoA dioxygenase [Verrucomicrobia bacterium LW23]|nr:phytanoyl-CoA dioxygenase [Verrucomicrobia bacterium LW23]
MITTPVSDALPALGVDDNTLSVSEKQHLDEQGFLHLPGLIPPAIIDGMRRRTSELLAMEGDNACSEFHKEDGADRLANLVDKGDVFRICYTHPRVLAAVAHVLQGDMKLSSLNSRFALPGKGLQALHADWGGAVAPGNYQVCNSIWLLDDFTPENGATRFVRASHRLGRTPQQEMADPTAPHPREELILAPAGTVVVFNSHLWHGGTLNRTDAPRRAVHSYWTRRGQAQQQNQRKLLRESTIAGLNEAERILLDVD